MAGPNSTPLRSSGSVRSSDLDFLKTLLVVAMVGAHVIQLITFAPRAEARVFAEYANLVSFSGFLFAFGIGLGLPKPERGAPSLWRRLRPAALLLLAVYASSFAFALLGDRVKLTPDVVLDVLTMRRLFGWSEFLATFFVLSVLMLVARPLLVAIGRNPWLLVGVSAACLATTYLKTGLIVPLLPTLVSHTGFANFPLLPYLPWFLVGIWYGSYQVRWYQFMVALGVTGWLYWVTLRTGEFPQRFPPSILWIVGPAAILLAYLAVSRWLAANVTIPAVLLVPGRHVLSFLVLSNIAFFATRNMMNRPVRGTLMVVVVTLGVLAALTLGWMAWEAWRRRSIRQQPSAVSQPG